MPPKRKSSLSRKTPKARDMAVVRGEESEERRAQRQEGNRLGMIETRQNESQEQRAQRLASNNHRYSY